MNLIFVESQDEIEKDKEIEKENLTYCQKIHSAPRRPPQRAEVSTS